MAEYIVQYEYYCPNSHQTFWADGEKFELLSEAMVVAHEAQEDTGTVHRVVREYY